MEYTSRLADSPAEAHVNYECPCGCIAGLMYDRESGSKHLGQCCCGRLLWVGPDSVDVVTSHFDASFVYEIEVGSVTLPWGDTAITALAVPAGLAAAPASDHGGSHEYTAHESARVKDVVCGMMIDPARAAATSEYKEETYYFCAPICKTRFDAAPERYVSA